jgi:hypothetical protein
MSFWAIGPTVNDERNGTEMTDTTTTDTEPTRTAQVVAIMPTMLAAPGVSTYPRFDGTQACAGPPAATAPAYAGTLGANPKPAQVLCHGCTFATACRGYALDHDVHGVWGGLTEEERSALRITQHLAEPLSVCDELDELVMRWREAELAINDLDPVFVLAVPLPRVSSWV